VAVAVRRLTGVNGGRGAVTTGGGSGDRLTGVDGCDGW